MFDRSEYDLLSSIVFRRDFPGFRPDVKELPNGDGKVDEKQYAHISLKYLAGFGTSRERLLLTRALFVAHETAERVADALAVPQAYRPDIRYGALRVLKYPAQTGFSHKHTDLDLFTLACYRDQPDMFVVDPTRELALLPEDLERIMAAIDINPGLHLGELCELIGTGPATPHSVLASEETQHSIVYFAIPDWDAKLPLSHGRERATVKDWLNERMARSRTAFKSYE